MSTTITRLDTFESWRLDATTLVRVDNRTATTEHPIEDGSVVTDHAQKLPTGVVVEGIVTDTPLTGTTLDVLPGRARRAQSFFEELIGVQVSVQTPKHGTFSPCLLQSYPFTDDGPSRLGVSLSFVEVEFGEIGFVDIPPEITTSTGLASVQEVGDQATTTLPDNAATQGKSSILLGLLQSIGGGG